jgi:A/G-specific adenine glycosylase
MMDIDEFKQILGDYYHQNKRALAWRTPEPEDLFDPYKIMISEVMLQQTQVPRVAEKYKQFLEVFPTVQALAQASLSDVLFVWQGLGYNRRGRYLRDAALMIVNDYGGQMPLVVAELVRLPGIGHNTACAILTYTYNQPLIFIETNIRSVYLHHFFQDNETVADKDILELVAQTLDKENPREFYWALMDYGTYVKKTFGNPNIRSKHYTKQSTFAGSNRQLRGIILRQLTEEACDIKKLQLVVGDPRLTIVLDGLIKDSLVVQCNRLFLIAS